MFEIPNKKNVRWDKWNREHIKKHGLNPRQVDEVFTDENLIMQQTYKERAKFIGRCGKIILSVVVSEEVKKFYIVSARIASKEERLAYYENEQK